ncbi:MAG: hypothetical protein L0211_20175 [Planctomycetaceae bacterium]|nr:hypothetical protein [Planctomycetaceae bacterium]
MSLSSDLSVEPRPTDDWLARLFEHAECGHETLISGENYVLLECPFRAIESTMCAGCGHLVPLASIAWCDTGENVAQYRQRIYNSVAFWRRMYLMLLGTVYEGAVTLNLDAAGRPKATERQLAR